MKPEDIPQGVWNRADDMAFYDPSSEDRNGELSRYKLRESIARAIMAEREACAAEMDRRWRENANTPEARAAYSNAAAAIRNRP